LKSIVRSLSLAALGLLALVPGAYAQSATYTFEAPNFTVGENTPLLNRSPNSGDLSFLADFTAAPNVASFQVNAFTPNLLFSGNSLFQPLGAAGNTLTVLLNQPVTMVDLVFATIAPGSLQFTSTSGSTTVASTPQGGTYPGGMLSFSSVTPFTSFSLASLNVAGGPGQEFAIDNLTVTNAAVPEPGSVALLIGMASVSGMLIRRRRK
jgi:hypothetical protein